MSLINGKELSKTALGRKLTVKQKAFAREYIRTGNLAEAARRAGHPPKNAKKLGWQYMNDKRYVNVKMYVEMLQDGVEDIKKLTPEHIAIGMLKEATEGDVAGARVRAWELLGKWRGMLVDKVEDVTQQPLISLLKALKKVDREMAEQLAPMFGYTVNDLNEEHINGNEEGSGQGPKEEEATGNEERQNGQEYVHEENDNSVNEINDGRE